MCRDSILINGLEFYGYHGASDQEQTVGHRYLVDIRLGVDIVKASISDQLSDTVNYSRAAKCVISVATTEQFRLLEALAKRIIDVLFLEFPSVEEIELRLHKTCPPMNAILASVGVELHRTRSNSRCE